MRETSHTRTMAAASPSLSRSIVVLIAATIVAGVSCIISVAFGPVPITIPSIIQTIFTHTDTSTNHIIVWQIRLPRIVMAALIGAALAASGTGLQSLLRNDLADPYILGISAGASAAAVLIGLTSLSAAALFVLQPAAAFVGATTVLFLVIGLSYKYGRIDTRSLLLSGVILSAFLWAVEMSVLRLTGRSNEEILNYLMGSLASSSWQEDLLFGIIVLIGVSVLILLTPSMNLFALGEESSRQLGLDAERFKWCVILVSTALAASAVSMVGIIGFIGLIAPHIARKLARTPDHRFIVPLSALCGATLLIWSDSISRTVLTGDVLPVGIVTAFLGAPFFCYKLRTE